MPTYKYAAFMKAITDSAFDSVLAAATPAPWSGIYRCEGCGHEVSSTFSHPLPPQNHHEHTVSQGKIRWQLVTAAIHVHKGKH